MDSVAPITVFDGDLIRASLFNPQAKRLLVTFRQRVPGVGGFWNKEPVRGMIRNGFAQLHLQSLNNDWYINSETQALERTLHGICGNYDRVVAMGFSMGGYAALRLSEALRLDHVLAISPQFTIEPGVVAHNRQWSEAKHYDAALGDLTRHGRRDLRGVVVLDPFRKMDLNHALHIQAAFPKITLCRLACGGHPASQVIGQSGGLWKLHKMLGAGRLTAARVQALHRSGRRESPTYWKQLARVAGRNGRAQLRIAAELRHDLLVETQES